MNGIKEETLPDDLISIVILDTRGVIRALNEVALKFVFGILPNSYPHPWLLAQLIST